MRAYSLIIVREWSLVQGYKGCAEKSEALGNPRASE
jgi:hypothetical protein